MAKKESILYHLATVFIILQASIITVNYQSKGSDVKSLALGGIQNCKKKKHTKMCEKTNLNTQNYIFICEKLYIQDNLVHNVEHYYINSF